MKNLQSVAPKYICPVCLGTGQLYKAPAHIDDGRHQQPLTVYDDIVTCHICDGKKVVEAAVVEKIAKWQENSARVV